MKYKLVLFDFDGTLADSADWFLKQLNSLADEFKFSRIDPADFEKLRGYSSKQIIQHMGMPLWKLPALMTRMRKAAAQHNGAIRLFPGVDSMLLELEQKGASVGIVSSNAETNIRQVLGSSNAARVRHFSCGASLFGKAVKLRGALRRHRIAAKESIYIGDEIRDATAAREAGMAFGAVEWGFTSAAALRKENPELMFSTVEEISKLLR